MLQAKVKPLSRNGWKIELLAEKDGSAHFNDVYDAMAHRGLADVRAFRLPSEVCEWILRQFGYSTQGNTFAM